MVSCASESHARFAQTFEVVEDECECRADGAGRGECVERDIVESPIVHGEWRVRGGDARSRSLGPRGCEIDGDERHWK